MTKLALIKRRSLVAVIICGVLAAASITFWQMNQSAEATWIYPHPGLVGWWRFDEESGTVAEDSSGYGNDGTLLPTGSEPQWVDGKYGGALSFDGENDYVQLPYDMLSQLKSFTVLAWINLENVGSHCFIYSYNINGEKFYVSSSSAVVGYIWNGSRDNLAYGPSTVQLNDWTFCAHVVNYNEVTGKTTQTVYVNGVAGTPNTFLGSGAIGTGGASIGSLWKQYYSMNGAIDEVRVYNRALSAAEIQEQFQKSPDFSSTLLSKIPKGTTQVIATISWQGVGNINVTIQSPSQNYTEDMVPMYQKTTYSTSEGTSSMLNIKRLSVPVAALSSEENWYIVLKFDDVEDYRITVEAQK